MPPGGVHTIKTTRGMRIYLATPRLRGLLALNLSVAAAGAMVIVNTVVIVRGLLGHSDTDVALALACFGGGSPLTMRQEKPRSESAQRRITIALDGACLGNPVLADTGP